MSRRKPGRLAATYSKREKDIVYHYPRSPDGHLLHSAICYYPIPGCDGRSLVKELERRGYDVTTLRFSIDRKPEAGE